MMEHIKGIQRDVIIPGKITRFTARGSVLNDAPSINDVANSHLVPRADGSSPAKNRGARGWR